MAITRKLIPKGCTVHAIKLEAKGAEVSYRCGDEWGGKTFPLSRGEGFSTYPSRFVRGIRRISHRGMHVSGEGARINFTATTCRRSSGR